MDLVEHSGTLQESIYRQRWSRLAYHWGIKLVQAFPLVLALFHDIDLVVLERSLCLYIMNNSFCIVAKAAWGSREEGDAAGE